MTKSRLQLTTLGIISLVALRLGLGWHFYMEGVAKLRSEQFTSKYFLQSATGPLAPLFHGMISDRDGQQRLNAEETIERWGFV